MIKFCNLYWCFRGWQIFGDSGDHYDVVCDGSLQLLNFLLIVSCLSGCGFESVIRLNDVISLFLLFRQVLRLYFLVAIPIRFFAGVVT